MERNKTPSRGGEGMKKAWTKLLVACMAAMLAVGVCFAFTACDEGRGPHVDEVHTRFGQ